ncbi:unnamed protein product [Rotaria magnacalcarata]|uniref:BED-type domain-containing protein n=1 Tax=Rotaria magnacalcarata TaxID=392030 RepID=A0A816MW96_9BILA|nr:unnamed protein product [Rotaria magnacalcarata]
MNFLKQFFEFTRPGNNNISGQCKLCGKLYADKLKSTGNFHKHLKRKHTTQYEESKFSDSIPTKNDTNDYSENLTSNVIKINQVILEELIVKCNLPPSIIEHNGFRNFLKMVAPKWKPTSARHFTKTLLPSLLNNVQDKIKNLLDSVDHLCITVDVWTDRRGRSFAGVTGHFLDLEYVPQALLLDFLRLKGPHTGENIQNITIQILDNMKIKGKVYRIITDNACSMIKAYKFGLSVTDIDYTVQDDNKQQQDDDYDGLSEWLLVDWCENNNDLFDKGNDPAKRLSCFAHSLQLTIRDGLKYTPYLSKSLSKCINLARRSHKSTKIADILDDIGKTINKSNMTRWSSEYLLIKSIIGLGKKSINEITDVIDDNGLKFSNDDFVILQEAVQILEPFAEITSRIQSESVVTASLVVPSVVHIIDHLKTIKSNISFLKKLCLQLEQATNERFSGIVKRLSQQIVYQDDPFSDPIYFVCTVLDPEFKFFWLVQMNYTPILESQMKQHLIQMILNECEKNIDTSFDNLESSSSSSTLMTNSHTTQSIDASILKKRKLFQYDERFNSSVGSTMTPINEINVYINDPIRSKFSLYWKNSDLYCLKGVVKRAFSIQATSAPIERVFSQAGIIMSPRRTSMNEEVFKSLVFLRVNQNMI